MNAPIDFNPSRIKIKGANSNIDRLRKLTSPLDRSLYSIDCVEKRGPVIYLNPPKFYELTYRPKEPIPETLANIIGHAFGDLRSALDYLAKRIGIARIPDFNSKKPFYFPAAPREELPAHSSLAPIERAIPGFKKLLLEEIRPINGPDERLWSFADLNNDSKHSDFIPTVTVAEISGMGLSFRGVSIERLEVQTDAARPQILYNSDTPIAIKRDFEATVEVKFGKGTLFENDSVVPTLFQISEIVSKTINAVERLVIG
jgi:hypothetical protein